MGSYVVTDETVVEMRPIEDSVRIAVASEKISNLQRELALHTIDDKEFQVKIFNFLQSSINDLNVTVKDISKKLDTVWDDMTLRKGKTNAWDRFGGIINASITIFLSCLTAYIIMKYGK